MSALKEHSSQINNVIFFQHFIAFLGFLKENRAKLTQTKKISLKVMDQIAQFIPKPAHFTEEWPLRTESEWWYLELIDILAEIMKLTANRKGHRILTKIGASYLQAPLEEQYYQLFRTYWERLNWAYLFSSSSNEPAEILQMVRDYAGRTLLGFSKDSDDFMDFFSFAEFLRTDLDLKVINYLNVELPERARDCVQQVFIEPLELFGVLELKEEKSEYGYDKLKSFKLTDLGKTLLTSIIGKENTENILPSYHGNPSLN